MAHLGIGCYSERLGPPTVLTTVRIIADYRGRPTGQNGVRRGGSGKHAAKVRSGEHAATVITAYGYFWNCLIAGRDPLLLSRRSLRRPIDGGLLPLYDRPVGGRNSAPCREIRSHVRRILYPRLFLCARGGKRRSSLDIRRQKAALLRR